MREKRLSTIACLALFGALCTVPAFGQTVFKGVDSWVTRGDGSSFSDFARQPIPAGFFCQGSKVFTGKIVWRGTPIVTEDPRIEVDTIVERLDDATFNRRGQAVTRIKVRALSLESVAPLKTGCGSFNVRANLLGEQPVTRMQIFREDESGGRYLAPLALNVKLTFTPVGRGRSLELAQHIRLGVDPRAVWSFNPEKAGAVRPRLQVDTDGDGIADTLLPRSSNFAAGKRASTDKYWCSSSPSGIECHAGSGHEHCFEACGGPGGWCELTPETTVLCP